MEKLKEYLIEKFGKPKNFEEIEEKAHFFSIKHIEKLFSYSKHKLEYEIFLCNLVIRTKYPKKKYRLLGTDSKAMPHDVYEKLINSLSNEKLRLVLKYEGIEGPRGEDAVKLKLNDLNFKEHKVTIYNTKAKRFYSIPLNVKFEEELTGFINRHKKEINEHNGFIFFSSNPVQKREYLSEKYLRNLVVGKLKELGLEEEYAISSNGRHLNKYGLHSLRGHAATELFKKTHNIKLAQILLDHKDSEVTMLYIGGMNNELVKAMRS